MCSRPVIEVQVIARRTFARCTSCTRLSPPDAPEPWASAHRDAAITANTEIDCGEAGEPATQRAVSVAAGARA